MASAGGRRPKPTTSSIDPIVMAAAREALDALTPTRRALRAAPKGNLRRAVLAVRLAEALDVLATEAVEEARALEDGPTWAGVGEAFGMRAQSAQQRFRVARSEPGA